jgi:hypothetical protein
MVKCLFVIRDDNEWLLCYIKCGRNSQPEVPAEAASQIEPHGPGQTTEEEMGGPKSDDVPLEEPIPEEPGLEEVGPASPPDEPPWELPDMAESLPEQPDKPELAPESAAGTPDQPEVPEAEAIPPAEPERGRLPSWLVTAEEEAAARAAAAATAPPPAPEPIPAAALKSAPSIDWSGPESVAETAAALVGQPAPSSVLPERGRLMEIPSPVRHPPEAEPVPVVEAPEKVEEEIVLARITKARQLGLMARIDGLLEEIYLRFSAESERNTLEEVLKLLKAARHTLIENPRDFDTAEYYTFRAKMLIDRFQRVRADSYRWTGVAIAIYEVALAVLVVLGWLSSAGIASVLAARGVPEWAFAPWTTMMASAAGAILGALWALVEHVATRQDFSKQYRMWYYVSPIKGLLLGAAIYFMLHAGTLAMEVVTPVSEGGTPLDPNWFLQILAFLVGFQQNVALDLFERLVKLIRPAREETTTPTGSQ